MVIMIKISAVIIMNKRTEDVVFSRLVLNMVSSPQAKFCLGKLLVFSGEFQNVS